MPHSHHHAVARPFVDMLAAAAVTLPDADFILTDHHAFFDSSPPYAAAAPCQRHMSFDTRCHFLFHDERFRAQC